MRAKLLIALLLVFALAATASANCVVKCGAAARYCDPVLEKYDRNHDNYIELNELPPPGSPDGYAVLVAYMHHIPVCHVSTCRRVCGLPPTVKILKPANGQRFSSSTVYLTVKAEDSDKVKQLAVFVDGNRVVTSSVWSTSVERTYALKLRDGRHAITVTAVNGLGKKASASVTVYVVTDSVPPVISIQPSGGTFRAAPNSPVVVRVVAKDNRMVSELSVSVNGRGPVKRCSSASCSVAIRISRPGYYRIEAFAVDWAGNRAAKTAYVRVVRDEPPRISLGGITYTFYENYNPEFSCNPALVKFDRNHDNYIERWEMNAAWWAYLMGRIPGRAVSAVIHAFYHHTPVCRVKVEGAKKVTVRTSSTVWIPARWIDPETGKVRPVRVTLTAKASDDVGVKEVDFYVDGRLACRDAKAPYECSVSLTPGSHTVKAVAVDTASQKSSAERTVVVKVDEPPKVSVTAPGVVWGGSVLIKATASDDRGVRKVAFFVDGAEVGEASRPPYEVAVHLSPGVHEVKAVAVDTAGQTASNETEVAVYEPVSPKSVELKAGPVDVRISERGTYVDVYVHSQRGVLAATLSAAGRTFTQFCRVETAARGYWGYNVRAPETCRLTFNVLAKPGVYSAKITVYVPRRNPFYVPAWKGASGWKRGEYRVAFSSQTFELHMPTPNYYWVETNYVAPASYAPPPGGICFLGGDKAYCTESSLHGYAGIAGVSKSAVLGSHSSGKLVAEVSIPSRPLPVRNGRIAVPVTVSIRSVDSAYPTYTNSKWVPVFEARVKVTAGGRTYVDSVKNAKSYSKTFTIPLTPGANVKVEFAGRIFYWKSCSFIGCYETVRTGSSFDRVLEVKVAAADPYSAKIVALTGRTRGAGKLHFGSFDFDDAAVIAVSVSTSSVGVVKHGLEAEVHVTGRIAYRDFYGARTFRMTVTANGKTVQTGWVSSANVAVPVRLKITGGRVDVRVQVAVRYQGARSLHFTLEIFPTDPHVLLPGTPSVAYYTVINKALGWEYQSLKPAERMHRASFPLDGKEHVVHTTATVFGLVPGNPDEGKRPCVADSLSLETAVSNFFVDGKRPGTDREELQYWNGRRMTEAVYTVGVIPKGKHFVFKTERTASAVETFYAYLNVTPIPKSFSISVRAPKEVPLKQSMIPVFVHVVPGRYDGFPWCPFTMHFTVAGHVLPTPLNCQWGAVVEEGGLKDAAGASAVLKVKVCEEFSGVCRTAAVKVSRSAEYLKGSSTELLVRVKKGYYPLRNVYLDPKGGDACIIGSVDSKLKRYGDATGYAAFNLKLAKNQSGKLIAVDTAGNADYVVLVFRVSPPAGVAANLACGNGGTLEPHPIVIPTQTPTATPSGKLEITKFEIPASCFKPGSIVTVNFEAYSSAGELEKAELYFDGKLVDTASLSGHVYRGSMSFRIGKSGGIVKLVVYDSTGLRVSREGSVKVCPCPVSVEITTPNDKCLPSGKTLTVSFNAYAACGLKDAKIYVNGALIDEKKLSGTRASSSFAITVPNTPGSMFTVKIVVDDAYGHSATAEKTFSVCIPPKYIIYVKVFKQESHHMSALSVKSVTGKYVVIGWYDDANDRFAGWEKNPHVTDSPGILWGRIYLRNDKEPWKAGKLYAYYYLLGEKYIHDVPPNLITWLKHNAVQVKKKV